MTKSANTTKSNSATLFTIIGIVLFAIIAGFGIANATPAEAEETTSREIIVPVAIDEAEYTKYMPPAVVMAKKASVQAEDTTGQISETVSSPRVEGIVLS